MHQKNKWIVTSVVMGIVMVITVIVLVQTPPPKKDAHEHTEKPQNHFISTKLSDIDSKKGKLAKLQLKEYTNTDCANELAQGLAKLNAVGIITIDTKNKIISIQYDHAKTGQQQILEAVISTNHEASIIETKAK